jgi:hypothetical protein
MYVVKRPDEIIQELLSNQSHGHSRRLEKTAYRTSFISFTSHQILLGLWDQLMERDHFKESTWKWEDNIKIDLKRNRLGVDFIYQTQNRDKWQALVSTLLNLLSSTQCRLFFD